MLPSLMLAPPVQPLWCGLALGLAAGAVDIRDSWELAGRGPFLPSVSPTASIGCALRPTVHLSADVTPWYVHQPIYLERSTRQWWTATVRWLPMRAGKMDFGPVLTLGNNALGVGAAGRWSRHEDARAIDLRVLQFPTDPLLNLQVQALYTITRRPI